MRNSLLSAEFPVLRGPRRGACQENPYKSSVGRDMVLRDMVLRDVVRRDMVRRDVAGRHWWSVTETASMMGRN